MSEFDYVYSSADDDVELGNFPSFWGFTSMPFDTDNGKLHREIEVPEDEESYVTGMTYRIIDDAPNESSVPARLKFTVCMSYTVDEYGYFKPVARVSGSIQMGPSGPVFLFRSVDSEVTLDRPDVVIDGTGPLYSSTAEPLDEVGQITFRLTSEDLPSGGPSAYGGGDSTPSPSQAIVPKKIGDYSYTMHFQAAMRASFYDDPTSATPTPRTRESKAAAKHHADTQSGAAKLAAAKEHASETRDAAAKKLTPAKLAAAKKSAAEADARAAAKKAGVAHANGSAFVTAAMSDALTADVGY